MDGIHVSALALSGGDLLAGGYFTNAGGMPAANMAKWDGTNWTALGSGMNGPVIALAVSDGNVYAGGWFTTAGGGPASGIAKWDGGSWSGLGSAVNADGYVYALAASGSNVYAGGDFYAAGDIQAFSVAEWGGSGWSALGPAGLSWAYDVSVPGSAYALAVSGGDLYAGGGFTSAGGRAANGVAKWDGSTWSALGRGLGSPGFGMDVSALVPSGSSLYAGGNFGMSCGECSYNIVAQWNGSSWRMLLGSWEYEWVYALAVSGSDLYAGGFFTAATNIAKWNGSSWSVLGAGVNGGVFALAMSGSDLYVGGNFTTAGGHAASAIAKWDGSSWRPLGAGMTGAVFAVAASDRSVYAGGFFTNAGDGAANYIAKWDGNSWTALGSGMDGPVYAVAVSGSDVYAGGAFTHAGGNAANYIAKWDGTNWTALGSGMGSIYGQAPYVHALAVSGSDLYVGGDFTTAGGKISAYVAKAVLNFSPLAVAHVSPLFAISPNDTNLFILAPNNAAAAVVLDASRSSDADDDPLQFFWYGDGQTSLLATGAVATVLLPVGPHRLTLAVSDGQHTNTADVSFEIITPASAVGQMVTLVKGADLNHIQPLLASLKAAQASFDRGRFNAGVHELGAFQDKVHAQVEPLDPALAARLIQTAQQIIAALSGSETNPAEDGAGGAAR